MHEFSNLIQIPSQAHHEYSINRPALRPNWISLSAKYSNARLLEFLELFVCCPRPTDKKEFNNNKKSHPNADMIDFFTLNCFFAEWIFNLYLVGAGNCAMCFKCLSVHSVSGEFRCTQRKHVIYAGRFNRTLIEEHRQTIERKLLKEIL